MKQKKIWSGTLIMALVFGLVLVGCKTDGDDGDKGVKLPQVYQNTTWKNTSEDIGNQYTKIAFKTTSATLFRDQGNITDNTGTVFNVTETGPNNQYTSQLNTPVSQISLTEYVKPVSGEGDIATGPTIFIFVKDDGTGILVQNDHGGGHSSEEDVWESWVKQP